MNVKVKSRRKKIIFLVGPTAVGKTDVAIALAKNLNAEIVSCDSMQIYKGMDIGTQKPSEAVRKGIRHHMIDILTPDKEFSAADFRRRGLRIIKAIHKKGKIPLFVGGTGLYMKALIDGLFPSPPKDEALRKRLYKQNEMHKGDYLYGKLKEVDLETAKRIHPNDIKKIVRALEIYYTTGRKISELKANTKPLSDKYKVLIFGLNRQRDELYGRIDERVDRMFEEGFLKEAENLSKKKLSITAAQAIGYKEAIGYLRGNNKERIREDKGYIRDNKDIEELKGLIKKNTRHYAKRQLTWFRKDKRIRWIEIKPDERPDEVAARIYRGTDARAAAGVCPHKDMETLPAEGRRSDQNS